MRAVAFVLAAAAPYHASALLDHGARRALRGRRLRGATFGLVTRTSPSDAKAMYSPQQSYGRSVAIDGDIAVVGAPGDSREAGAAYVLRTTDGGATYVELAKLTASDGGYDHRFGWSVAIDGNTIVVGAPGTVSQTTTEDIPGAAYVYRTTDGWASHTEIKLAADDADERDGVGGAVAIAGGTIVVGAWNGNGGAAYVYRTTDGGGTYPQVAKLSSDCVNVLYPSQPCFYDAFGASVAISEVGDTIVAGAWGHDDAKYDAGTYSASSDMGSAYVLRTTDDWSTHTTTKLTAADAAKGDEFGISVAIDGDTVVVGAWKDDDTGSAYVFRASDGTQLAKVTASDAAAGDKFGNSVAIAGDTIVVGAKRKDETNFGAHGAAYVYRTSDGGATYSQMDKLAGSDDNGSFGTSVAIDGSTVLVGESGGEDPDGVVFDGMRARSGVVHVFSSDASLWWSSAALDSKGSSSGGSSGGSDSSTGAIVAGCVFGAFALLFVGAVVYFYRLSPEEQAAAKEKFWAAEAEGEKKFWAAEAEGEKQVKALFAKAEAEGEPETAAGAAAEEAAP